MKASDSDFLSCTSLGEPYKWDDSKDTLETIYTYYCSNTEQLKNNDQYLFNYASLIEFPSEPDESNNTLKTLFTDCGNNEQLASYNNSFASHNYFSLIEEPCSEYITLPTNIIEVIENSISKEYSIIAPDYSVIS